MGINTFSLRYKVDPIEVDCQPKIFGPPLEHYPAQYAASNAKVAERFGLGDEGKLFSVLDTSIRAEDGDLFHRECRLDGDRLEAILKEVTADLGETTVETLRVLVS